MESKKSWARGWRGMALIAIGLVMGINLIAPAAAHIGTTVAHLWGHIRPLADARYLRVGETKIIENDWDVNFGLGAAEVREYTDVVRIHSTSAGDAYATLHLTAPRQLGRRTFSLKSVRICYRVSTGDRIDETSIYHQFSGNTVEVFEDLTDRTYSTFSPLQCFTVIPSPAIAPSGSLELVLVFSKDAAGDYLDVAAVTGTWKPTGSATSRPVAQGTSSDAGSAPVG